MRSLFDLTPSEARVARGLAAGETLEEMRLAAVWPSFDGAFGQLTSGAGKDRMHPPGQVVSLLANVTLDALAKRTMHALRAFTANWRGTGKAVRMAGPAQEKRGIGWGSDRAHQRTRPCAGRLTLRMAPVSDPPAIASRPHAIAVRLILTVRLD